MSIIYIIITNNEIESLKKDRYLTFTEHEYTQGFLVYIRFDRQFDMIKSFDELTYELSDKGKALLTKTLDSNSSDIFWSMVDLENHMGEEGAYLNCLQHIKRQEFETKVLNESVSFIQNKIYKLL